MASAMTWSAPVAIAAAGETRFRPGLNGVGRAALIDGEAALRQAVMMVLCTRPGERLMRPDYGCPLHLLAFEPNDAATAGLAIHYVRRALARFIPEAEGLSVEADRDPGHPSLLSIRISFTHAGTRRRVDMALEAPVAGGDGDERPAPDAGGDGR